MLTLGDVKYSEVYEVYCFSLGILNEHEINILWETGSCKQFVGSDINFEIWPSRNLKQEGII